MDFVSADALAKPLSLVLLAVQNFLYGILLPLSRKPDAQGNQFFSPSSVVAMELMKIIFEVVGIFAQKPETNVKGSATSGRYQPIMMSEHSSRDTVVAEKGIKDEEDVDDAASEIALEEETHIGRLSSNGLVNHLVLRWQEAKQEIFTAQALRMCVPAILYVIQNNLQMFSGGYLTATEFQVLSQLKLVSTAFFSVWLLGKRLSPGQWGSIALLMAGTATVQVSSYMRKQAAAAAAALAAPTHTAIAVQAAGAVAQDLKSKTASTAFLYGTVAIVLACLCSGLAGVLIEMQLKRKTGFWITNLHLSMFSLLPAFIPLFTDAIMRNRFEPFRFFTLLTWSTVLVNAIGGILVAMVLKFADNILKGFAVCAALLATVLYNSWESGQGFSVMQFVGAVAVASSTMWYANSPPKQSQPAVEPASPSPSYTSESETVYDADAEEIQASLTK
jgi:UDP-sugar transporter A1/2/3